MIVLVASSAKDIAELDVDEVDLILITRFAARGDTWEFDVNPEEAGSLMANLADSIESFRSFTTFMDEKIAQR